ncbi:SIR2-like protein [Kushneria sinocarnis]|uniref:SIR2-like protein n=1 Tax=Kushneria sinocarnis TaxID=595502 RepID=A0A420WYX3_9GAMM|nr:SIR2 family protein [Kushneria sinocarnis]RKR06541.1 SIR2-like protein [Kushneria sinocarnis]
MTLSKDLFKKVILEAEKFYKNSPLNNEINNSDSIEVVVRKGQNEYTIPKVAEALFYGDPEEYRQQIAEAKANYKRKILRLDVYEENEGNYEKIFNLIKKRAAIIPFVGAGFSVSAGCPSWSDYIIEQAKKARLSEAAIEQRIAAGEHEALMTEIIHKISLDRFKRDFEHRFHNQNIAPALSPCTEFDGLFEQCIITTNFDRVLEEGITKPFSEKQVGTENSGRFIRAIFSGDHYLLKLHGNIDEENDRVLTAEEYDSAYGKGQIDWNLPIPKKLKKIFGNYSTIFLGCSLVGDRYLDVLKEVRATQSDFMPDHFAIVTAPDDEEERIERDKFLAELGITPIWFPHGDWEAPSEILSLIKLELNYS